MVSKSPRAPPCKFAGTLAATTKTDRGTTDLPAHAIHQSSKDAVEHALKLGDAVTVFGIATSGPMIEGIGTIESYGPGRDRYHIRFIGDLVTRLRFIIPEWQSNPERSLELLREFWRSSRTDHPLVEDFFIETNS